MGELPPGVRALIDAAAEIYVVTPTLPGRLAWLASAIDESRHTANERLDTVLSHLRSIGVPATGLTGDDSTLTAVTDAVAEFQPNHILLGLRGPDHAYWQERGLITHIEERFGLPLTTFPVHSEPHMPTEPGPDHGSP